MNPIARSLAEAAIEISNKMYGHLEDLRDILDELMEDTDLDFNDRYALLECKEALNEPELLDELVARLGCLLYNDDEE